jgi:hypothetical protein
MQASNSNDKSCTKTKTRTRARRTGAQKKLTLRSIFRQF